MFLILYLILFDQLTSRTNRNDISMSLEFWAIDHKHIIDIKSGNAWNFSNYIQMFRIALPIIVSNYSIIKILIKEKTAE